LHGAEALGVVLVRLNFSLRYVERAQRSHVLLPMPRPTDAVHIVHVSVAVIIPAVVRNLFLVDPHLSRENTGIDAHIPDAGHHRGEFVGFGEGYGTRGPNILFFDLVSIDERLQLCGYEILEGQDFTDCETSVEDVDSGVLWDGSRLLRQRVVLLLDHASE